jgi:hypothetical protein
MGRRNVAARHQVGTQPCEHLEQQRHALLPPCTTGIGSVSTCWIRQLEGGPWQAADQNCASRCGHSLNLGVAFVDGHIDSEGTGQAQDRPQDPTPQGRMRIILMLVLLCSLSGVTMADARTAPRTADQTAAWWGPTHHGHRNAKKTNRPHTGRRPISTHPERRRQF